MENGVNFAVPWKVQEPKSFQLQGLLLLEIVQKMEKFHQVSHCASK